MYSVSNGSFANPKPAGWFQDFHGHFKRKEDPLAEEEVVQLMSGVCLSPQKRPRLSSDASPQLPNGGFGHASAGEGGHAGVLGAQGLAPSPLGALPLPSAVVAPQWGSGPEPGRLDGVSAAAAANGEGPAPGAGGVGGTGEKALVLYRSLPPPPALTVAAPPVLPLLPPPLPPAAARLPGAMPGGPIVIPKSVLLPSSSGLIEQSSPSFMRALDLTGVLDEPTSAGSQRRLYRVNSCSSLPSNFYNTKASPQAMDEDGADATPAAAGTDAEKALAVIPWAPPPPVLPAAPPAPVLACGGGLAPWQYSLQQGATSGPPPGLIGGVIGSNSLPGPAFPGTGQTWPGSDMEMGDGEAAMAALAAHSPVYLPQAPAAAHPLMPGLWR